MRKLKLFLGITLAAIVSLSLLFSHVFRSDSYALSDKVDRLLLAMAKDMNSPESIKKHKYPFESSNPYDYTKNNQFYDALVALGPEALPVLEDKVIKSENNGLDEYILAIAAEEIAKVNLKEDNEGKFIYSWSNAKAWPAVWDSHLRSLPEKVKEITSSSLSKQKKADKLSRLGTPAIPFILDEIGAGNTEISASLDVLLKGDKKVVNFDSSKIDDIKQWSKDNNNKFEDLRELVNDHQ